MSSLTDGLSVMGGTFHTERLPLAIAIHASGRLAFLRCERIGPEHVEFVFDDPESKGSDVEFEFDSVKLTVIASEIFASQKYMRGRCRRRLRIGEPEMSTHDELSGQSTPYDGWHTVADVLSRHYVKPDIEAARILCAALAAHALRDFPPAWCLAIAPPGSMKTDLLESFRGLPGVHFVDEVTTNTFLSGKVDEKDRKRKKPASWLHRIGSDGVLVAADFSTFTSNPKTLQVILAQLRRIYDGNFSREFGTEENVEERSWRGRLTLFAGAVPDIDRHYSLFQKLGERFVRLRWERAGGVETGLQAMEHTPKVAEELKAAVHAILRPILSGTQIAPHIPDEIKRKIASLSELIALARTYIERDGYSREAMGMPVTEGNTRLPQQLSQIARGAALLDRRSEVNEGDYELVCRAAFDSVPPDRIAVLKAILDGRSPFSLGLPKATTDRAIDDLRLSGVLTDKSDLSERVRELLAGAGLTESPNCNQTVVPENTHGYRNEISPTIPPISGTHQPQTDARIERLLAQLGDKPGPYIDWDAPQPAPGD